ncbi:MAG: penicillin-binding transpeptidase domain-containing protein, partial [Bacteroidota bacterium]
QQYGEYLMKNKKGAIVAIEPATGEILSMVSAPSYDPNQLAGENFRSNYGNLLLNEHKPLFNRAIRAQYPPGSTFKTIQALIAQQENMVDAQTVFACNKNLVKCHFHPTTDLQSSIQHSCNPYYYRVFRRIVYQNRISKKDSAYTLEEDHDLHEGFDMWRSYLDQFNLGRKTGVDLVSEINGLIPKTSLYDQRYGADNWAYSNIYSLSIGQGEIGVLPIQLANVAATIANRGFYYTPHLVRGVGKDKTKRPEFTIKKQVPIDKKNFDLVITGMRDAYRNGTVAYFAVVDSLEICGKTGTAQNPHGEDHSVFIAFAPKDNPQIAISVHVENAGFGGAWAAPIAALMIERYLKGRTSKKMEITEKIVMGTKFIEEEDRPIFPEDENKIPE